jgi:cation:H+ antiporter
VARARARAPSLRRLRNSLLQSGGVDALLALVLLAAGIGLVVAGAELFFDGVLAAAARLGVAPFVVTAAVSGLELENLGAGIAANAKGLGGAAAGTFLGGTTFLALGVAGLGALVSPLEVRLPRGALLWTAAAPLPLFGLSLDGSLSRIDGGLMFFWFGVALAGLIHSGRTLPPSDTVSLGHRAGAVGAALRLLAGTGLLVAGGEALGRGIKETVAHVGVPQTLLGNTVIAASVEAEEVVRVAVPARHGRPEVGLANILGTIVHFAALNAGVIALVRPIELDDETLALHLPATVAATAVLCVLAARGLDRRAGGTLLALYAAYLTAAIVVALT